MASAWLSGHGNSEIAWPTLNPFLASALRPAIRLPAGRFLGPVRYPEIAPGQTLDFKAHSPKVGLFRNLAKP